MEPNGSPKPQGEQCAFLSKHTDMFKGKSILITHKDHEGYFAFPDVSLGDEMVNNVSIHS